MNFVQSFVECKVSLADGIRNGVISCAEWVARSARFAGTQHHSAYNKRRFVYGLSGVNTPLGQLERMLYNKQV
jgi:hypothetical protein